MSSNNIAVHRATLKTLDGKLDAPGVDFDSLKGEIITFYRLMEAEMAELTALKDDVKKMVEKWKTLSAGQSLAPQFSGEAPVVHADHIGASTFIEKGWSRLSLGDHHGSEVSLRKALELSPNEVQAETLLGWALMLQEKYDDALLMFQKVLMRQPQNALARIN